MKKQVFPENFDSAYMVLMDDIIYVRIPKVLGRTDHYTCDPVRGDDFEQTLKLATEKRAELFLTLHNEKYSPDSYYKHKSVGKNNKSGKTNVVPYVDFNKDKIVLGYTAIYTLNGVRKRQLITFKNIEHAAEAFVKAARLVDGNSGKPILSHTGYMKIYKPIDWETKIAERIEKRKPRTASEL